MAEHNDAWRGQLEYLNQKVTPLPLLAGRLLIDPDTLKNMVEAIDGKSSYSPRLLTIQSIDRLYRKVREEEV